MSVSDIHEVIGRSSIGASRRLRSFGERLKSDRHRAGRKAWQVAQWSGLTIGRVLEMEAGHADGTAAELITETEVRLYMSTLDYSDKRVEARVLDLHQALT